MAGVKMTGREFKAFMRDPAVWGADDSASAPDSVIEIDGVVYDDWPADVPDAAKIRFVGGGYMEDAPAGVPESFEGAARWWLKRQTMTTFMVECHKDARDEVVAAIKAAGGKIL